MIFKLTKHFFTSNRKNEKILLDSTGTQKASEKLDHGYAYYRMSYAVFRETEEQPFSFQINATGYDENKSLTYSLTIDSKETHKLLVRLLKLVSEGYLQKETVSVERALHSLTHSISNKAMLLTAELTFAYLNTKNEKYKKASQQIIEIINNLRDTE